VLKYYLDELRASKVKNGKFVCISAECLSSITNIPAPKFRNLVTYKECSVEAKRLATQSAYNILNQFILVTHQMSS
jgi:hypothetical protein